jgi:F0F1-type ATP synthase membrane subunit b/b'
LGDVTIFGLPVSLGTMVYQAIIFTILVFILKKLVFQKIVNILEKRKQHIENQLLLTEQYKQDAKKNLDRSAAVLKQARADAIEMLKHSENEANLIIEDAKIEARAILKQAKEESMLSRARTFSQTEKIKGA